MRVFLDTNVIVNGLKYAESNSKKILGLAESRAINAFTSELVLKEVAVVMRRVSGSRQAYYAVTYVQGVCSVVSRRKIVASIAKLRGLIKEKDLENIATVKSRKIIALFHMTETTEVSASTRLLRNS